MKKFIKSLIPPILIDLYQIIYRKKYGWHGNYKTWEEAKRASTGYDSKEILNKVRASLLKVKNGEAVYERDSVIFNEIQYSWPLLAGLMFAAAKSGGELRVLDFGGSLGSTYYQNKKFLDRLENVSWCIVEQKHFVDVGKEEFEDDRLKFYYDVENCVKNEKPKVLVLSSVLQYLEKPYEVLDELLQYNFEVVILDLTAFSVDVNEILTIQKVNPMIYSAQYPCWMLSLEKLIMIFQKNDFYLIEQFDALNGFEVFIGLKKIGVYKGQIWEKKK